MVKPVKTMAEVGQDYLPFFPPQYFVYCLLNFFVTLFCNTLLVAPNVTDIAEECVIVAFTCGFFWIR